VEDRPHRAGPRLGGGAAQRQELVGPGGVDLSQADVLAELLERPQALDVREVLLREVGGVVREAGKEVALLAPAQLAEAPQEQPREQPEPDPELEDADRPVQGAGLGELDAVGEQHLGRAGRARAVVGDVVRDLALGERLPAPLAPVGAAQAQLEGAVERREVLEREPVRETLDDVGHRRGLPRFGRRRPVASIIHRTS